MDRTVYLYNRRCVRLQNCIHSVNCWKHNRDASPENLLATGCLGWWM